MPAPATPPATHAISVVVPVYRGAQTIESLVTELLKFAKVSSTPGGARYHVSEIVLVDDNGPDRSDRVIRSLVRDHSRVRAVWLSRNFGQHAATAAGISATTAPWIVTMDEDGQHDPSDIAVMLDAALENDAQLVYADPRVPPGHGAFRNWASRAAQTAGRGLAERSRAPRYNSFRLISGPLARGLADQVSPAVYLDVALGWVVGRYAVAATTPRGEVRPSGYSLGGLVTHFRRLLISGGTRGLRFVSGLGVLFGVVGVVAAAVIVFQTILGGVAVPGWASTMVALFLTSGAVLFCLGIVAEYVGVNVHSAMGKPGYLILNEPSRSAEPDQPE